MAISDYTIGRPYCDGSGVCRSWFRQDFYNPSGNYNRVFVAGKNDNSPIFKHWELSNNRARYNSGCSCCFLGFAHSELCHIERLARHVSGVVRGSYAGLVSVDVRPVEYGGWSEDYPVFPMWEVWLVGEWGQVEYGAWDNEADAVGAAGYVSEQVTQ